MTDVNDFSELEISIATADAIRSWSNGEVKKPETINYRTLKPEKDGLFCEKIFGPTKDWECACGKYKRIRFKGIICERCGVEVTRSKVRRERMGHIELAAPVVHIWYLRGTRSWLAYLLMGTETKEELKAKQLEKVIYFAANLVTWVDKEKIESDIQELEAQLQLDVQEIEHRLEIAVNDRQNALENELRQMEEQGAKDSEIRARQRISDREITALRAHAEDEIRLRKQAFAELRELYPRRIIEDELLWREMQYHYGEYFRGGMGAEAVLDLISEIDFDKEEEELRKIVESSENSRSAKGSSTVDSNGVAVEGGTRSDAGARGVSAQRKQKAVKRLRIVSAFNRRDENGQRVNDPRAMILEVIPVIPPDLRPMVQLDGGRFATSDLNDLYRRVINRNNRLKRLLDLNAPEIIVNNEKRMLQEAVDALFDNGRRGRPVTGPGNRPLKSLSEMLKGKQGRFRQNLLGKRVDYSGRSVIVVGPTLKLHQCGLPKEMALELFKPFVMKRLTDAELAQNIKSAKRMVERRRPQVWEVLDEVIKEHPVLLNRAPTLHRLGIQAFEPILVEGKAIQIHPLVCTAFNADFDGDQMAVHLPLSVEAQAESRVLMLSANNILSPATGRPITVPTQDMVFGCYYLTLLREGAPGEGRVFRHLHEVEAALERGTLGLHARIKLRWPAGREGDPFGLERARPGDGSVTPEHSWQEGVQAVLGDSGEELYYEVETTPGRLLFNAALPKRFRFVNDVVGRRYTSIGSIVEEIAMAYPKQIVATSLDRIKELGFKYATRSGLTISIDDVRTPAEKAQIVDRYEKEAEKAERQFHNGIITDDERRQKEIEIWTSANSEIGRVMEQTLSTMEFNPLDMMVDSGARGNSQQIRQIAGMKGLVSNPRGEMIPRPIISSFREGLSVLEYFISTHGARKGLADTALRTADSGYLTRRLVDVSQELIVRELDCGTTKGIWIDRVVPDEAGRRSYLETRLFGRVLAQDVKLSDGSVIKAGTLATDAVVAQLRDDPAVDRVMARSVLTCDTRHGVCSACYGQSLATGRMIELGEAVGVIAAQSIGEPGTQLTMRTFHTGGVIGEDITHGLPRVVELVEARTPKGAAVQVGISGTVRIEELETSDRRRRVTVLGTGEDEGKEESYEIPLRAHLEVQDGQAVQPGDVIVEGPRDPKKLLEIMGIRATEQYLVEEVQKVYRDQGVSIHDKHIELIVRQMLRRRSIVESGDSPFLPSERVDAQLFEETNHRLRQEGKRPAEGRQELLGITKASLATDSWLSAASFQETTRVLTEAAVEGSRDSLVGLKENIIIGKLIPAGSGMGVYNDIEVLTPEAKPLTYWSSESTSGAPGSLEAEAWLRALGTSEPDGSESSDASSAGPEPPASDAPRTGGASTSDAQSPDAQSPDVQGPAVDSTEGEGAEALGQGEAEAG
jgi:DNA-directed RNA polymerase subunit beta'